MMTTMRKYRVTIRGAKKHMRHVRAPDLNDAIRQAKIIAEILQPEPFEVELGPAVEISIEDMGRVR